MFCHKPLGANEVVESFPVGRRLAFDSARGRLWVVCRRCERWNLTPLEERWEAVEDCERLFRDTRIRVSTENIGLARHPEGLTLVRIGVPLRPEFAAWRYGDQFGRRKRRTILYGTAGIVAVGGIVVGGAATGILSAAMLSQSGNLVNLWVNARTLVKLRPDDGGVIKLKRPDLMGTRIRPSDEDPGFELQVKKGKRKGWYEGESGPPFRERHTSPDQFHGRQPRDRAQGGGPDRDRRAPGAIPDRPHRGTGQLPRAGRPRLHQQDAETDAARARDGAPRGT